MEIEKKKNLIALIVVVLAFIMTLTVMKSEPHPKSYLEVTKEKEEMASMPTPILNGLYEVVRVVDGDTIIVCIDGEDIRVRLIGVNTDESVAPEEYGKENTEEGIIASDFTKKLLTGKSVYLEYDVEKEDKYGRTLAYVYTEDMQMVNALLVSNGLAELCTIPPNVAYSDYFFSLLQEARENKVGFWGTGHYE